MSKRRAAVSDKIEVVQPISLDTIAAQPIVEAAQRGERVSLDGLLEVLQHMVSTLDRMARRQEELMLVMMRNLDASRAGQRVCSYGVVNCPECFGPYDRGYEPSFVDWEP